MKRVSQAPRDPGQTPDHNSEGATKQQRPELPSEPPEFSPEPGIVDPEFGEEGILIDIMCRG